MNTWNQLLSFEKHICAVPSTIFGVRLSRLTEAFLVRTGLLQLCFLKIWKCTWIDCKNQLEIIIVIMHLKIIEYYYLGRFTKVAFWEFTFCSVISSNCIVNCEIVIKSFRYLLIRRVVFGDYFAIDIPSCSSDQFYISKLLRRCTKSNKIQHTSWSK